MGMSPRLLRPRATGFNPKSIANLAAWYDFNDSSTITISTGISSVTDKSGNGRALSQTTPNNQPTWNSAGLNGKGIASFDGLNDRLTASFTLAQPITTFLVGKFNTTTGGQTMLDGATGNRMRVFVNSATQIGFYAGNQINRTPSSVTAWHVFEVIWDGVNYLVGLNSAGTNVGGTIGTASPGGVALGAFGVSGGDNANCSVASLLVYTRALSATERSSVRKWLGTLYAITVT